MSRILCLTSGLTGITNASLELISRLQKQGHTVDYGSNRNVQDKVSQLGADFYLLDEIIDDYGPKVRFKNKVLRILSKLIRRKYRLAFALKKAEPLKLKGLLRSRKYDLVIVDMEMHEYIIAADSLGCSIVLLSQWFSNWPRPGLPSLLSEIIPDASFLHEEHWQAIRRERRKLFWRRSFQSGGTDRYSLLPRIAKRSSFPQQYIGENFWPGPFLYNELPVLSMTAFELEFPHKVRKNMHYLGPMVYTNRIEKVDEELRSAVASAKELGHKVVYCSLSTLHAGDSSFISKVIQAVRLLDKVFLILSLGGKISPESFDSASDTIIKSRIPQLFALRNADLSINHGGIHTINECIAFSVPMLVYSGKRSDQNGCSARVHFHKLGIAADKDKDDVKTISSKIHDILTKRIFFDNMRRINHACQKYTEQKTVEHIIDEYLIEKDQIK